MKMNSKKSLIALIVIFSISSLAIAAQTPETRAWSWETHYFIGSEAESTFTDGSFFSEHHNTLQTWCVKPDQGWGKSDWHWLDAITYHPLETTGGRLPWALKGIFDNIVIELENKNWQRAAELMGAASHFTEDGTNPLHSTHDYNPGLNHGNYEHEVNSHLNEIPIPKYAPRELDNVFEATMKTLEGSFNFTDEDPDGGVELSVYLEYDTLWNDTIKDITENRLQAGIQFTANLWYTAMIRAGLTIPAPTLTSPPDGATDVGNPPTLSWNSTDDINSYTIQISSDNNFKSGTDTVRNISDTSYTPNNQLDSGTWYWRIRTGDNSTHVGLWSKANEFTIASGSENAENKSEVPSKLRLITSVESGSGSITLDPASENYEEGTTVTITANPDSGYEFSHWSGDLSGTVKQVDITMNSDKDIAANFTKISEGLPWLWIGVLVTILVISVGVLFVWR
ncbi:hypothetical protein AKJ54_00625 [candidate division MSBL1 archaeon SCGC-AAA382K21]|uniref:Bacterial repeat domain-containing protein n=1 Tax=candidate division MSBL1 archaeon SCGC-AAA382K21 TaxID=1698283 RepID=A0A133VL91_9EURY|nr:hypothetical protein AKJ54_00625 [candidate division MSBL1 archaeon SCGC-AAA382K21]